MRITTSGGRKPPDSGSIDDRGFRRVSLRAGRVIDGQIMHLATGERLVLTQ